MATIFTKILAGDIPSHKLAETDDYYSFLDIRPLQKGHALVIPKRENDYIFDLEDEDLAGLMVFAKRIAKAMDAVIPCERIGVAVVGLEVPHTHIHLIPINSVSDMDFSKPITDMEQEEFKSIAEKISAALK